jgi:hypothetical protein
VSALDVPEQIEQALALGIISETEAAALRNYDAKVLAIINVDDFAAHELAAQEEPISTGAAAPSAHVA